MVLVAVRARHESLQIMLARNEVAGCLSDLRVAVDMAKVRGDMKVFLCVASNSCSSGNSWSKTQEVHKLDGFPHGVVILLLCRERTESTSVLLKKY